MRDLTRWGTKYRQLIDDHVAITNKNFKMGTFTVNELPETSPRDAWFEIILITPMEQNKRIVCLAMDPGEVHEYLGALNTAFFTLKEQGRIKED